MLIQLEQQYQQWIENTASSPADEASEEKKARLASRLEEQRIRLEQIRRNR